jgi:hypothetical protein
LEDTSHQINKKSIRVTLFANLEYKLD